jgi:acetolactate synthase-1/2/3 large subunit
VEKIEDITLDFLSSKEPAIIDVIVHPNTLIEPKLEMGKPIHDQYPYITNEEIQSCNPFNNYKRK